MEPIISGIKISGLTIISPIPGGGGGGEIRTGEEGVTPGGEGDESVKGNLEYVSIPSFVNIANARFSRVPLINLQVKWVSFVFIY
jgi:hypothetical protein